MPCGILGAVPDAAMNECYPLGVYAAVQKHLDRPLVFPGGLASWENPIDQSSAMLNAYLEEWTVLRDQTNRGEKFNATDGSAFTWGKPCINRRNVESLLTIDRWILATTGCLVWTRIRGS